MKLSKTAIILLVLSLTSQSYGQTKNIVIKKSLLNWTGKAAFSSYTLTGNIAPKNGSIKIENDSIISLNIIIDMKSINHEYADLKKHLKSKDFFEVTKYSEANFKLNKPVKIVDSVAVLIGNMTVKGITKEKNITINLQNNYSVIIFFTELDRTEYDIKFNSPSFFKKLKENAIADKFNLNGTLIFE